MTAPARPLALVDVEALPDYPIPCGTRLDSHGWFAFHHAWWRNSRFRMLADLDVLGVFWNLIAASQDEDPVGTLPTDEDMLARLARVSVEDWRRLAARKFPPLYGWKRCLCSDKTVKLFHPKLLDVTLSAVRFRQADAARKEEDRERKRIDHLKKQIVRAGGTQRIAEDEAYVLRLDQRLVDTMGHGVSRTVKRIKDAMEAMELADQSTLAG